MGSGSGWTGESKTRNDREVRLVAPPGRSYGPSRGSHPRTTVLQPLNIKNAHGRPIANCRTHGRCRSGSRRLSGDRFQCSQPAGHCHSRYAQESKGGDTRPVIHAVPQVGRRLEETQWTNQPKPNPRPGEGVGKARNSKDEIGYSHQPILHGRSCCPSPRGTSGRRAGGKVCLALGSGGCRDNG